MPLDDYARGRRDGLRLALAVLSAEEEKWAALLGGSRSRKTNAIREVRHKTLQVAQKRLRTALNRMTPKDAAAIDAELASALDRLGLQRHVARGVRRCRVPVPRPVERRRVRSLSPPPPPDMP